MPKVSSKKPNTKNASKKAVKKSSSVKAQGSKKAAAPKKVAKKAAKKSAKKPVKKAAKKSAKKTTKKVVKKQAAGGPCTRYFKVIIDEGDAHGRFSGQKPKQAANKALTSILKSKEKDGDNVAGKIKFSIVECTRGSRHKQYNYVGERIELENPMTVTIGSGDNKKEIEYKFNNKVMKDKTA